MCAPCTQAHRAATGYSYASLSIGLPRAKEVLREHWDDRQLMVISPLIGGNRRFFDFLEDYNLHSIKETTLEKRYKSDAVKYYAKRLAAVLDGRQFSEKPPAKDWDERFERAKSAWQEFVESSERKMAELGDKVGEKMAERPREKVPERPKEKAAEEKVDWKTKFKSAFKFSTNKAAKKPEAIVAGGAMGDALAAAVENPLAQQEPEKA